MIIGEDDDNYCIEIFTDLSKCLMTSSMVLCCFINVIAFFGPMPAKKEIQFKVMNGDISTQSKKSTKEQQAPLIFLLSSCSKTSNTIG